MSEKVIGNYLRVHRRRCGLSQHELARLVGYQNSYQTARHERNVTAPPLLTALAYATVFQVPVSAIFTGFQTTVAAMVEANLEEFANQMRGANENSRELKETMLKLQWLTERQKKQQGAE